MDINIDALYNILKQNQGDVNDAKGLKKNTVVVTSDTLALIAEKTEFVKSNDKKVKKKDDEKKRDMSKVKCYNCKKEGHFANDCKKVKVKDYEYYKTKILLTNKDKDEQVLLAEDQAWMESSSDLDQEINANMVFMAQIKKFLSDSKTSSSSADDKISKVSYYLSEYENEYEYETSRYYDNTTTYGLFVNDNDDQEFFHDCENFLENLIESQINHNESVVDHNDYEGVDKLIRKFNKNIAKWLKHIEKANQQNKDFENQNKDLQVKYDVLKNQATTFEMNDKELNEQKKIADQEVLYDKMSVQLVELDKHVRDLKNTVLEKDFKIFELEECMFNKDLDIEKCLERLNVCENKLHKMGQTNQTVHMIMPSKDKMYNGRKRIGFENPSYFCKAKDLRPTLYDERVINLGYTLMFLTHSNEALEIKKFKRARENKIEFSYDYGSLNASYVNEKITFSDDYFQEIINPDFDKIDSPIQQTSSLKLYVPTVILEKIIIDLEDEVVSLLEKEKENLKTIESLKTKDVETGVESNEKVVFEMENQITKMTCTSNGVENLNTLSSVRRPKYNDVIWMKNGSSINIKADLSSVNHFNLNKNVKRYSHKNLMACNNSDIRSAFDCNNAKNAMCNARMHASVDVNDLFVFDDIVQICLWIIDLGCSKHMTDGVDLLTDDRSSNLYTIALNEVASNSSTCLLAKASSSQSWLWHQHLSPLNFATINNLVKNNLLQGLPKMKFEKDHLCSTCEQGKIHQKHHKSKMAFASNEPLYLLHMDFCGPMRVKSINGKRYVLVVVDDYSWYTWVFFLHSKDEASDVIISFIKKTQLNLQLQVQCVRTDNGTEFKNKTLTKFFDELVSHKRFDKTPYELMNKRKPNIKLFRVLGCRCYLLNDYEDVGKLKAKEDIIVFVGYSKESAAFKIYNKRTCKIHESMNVNVTPPKWVAAE
nr:hypothetical protein [Tanacetum cinerariifolium]